MTRRDDDEPIRRHSKKSNPYLIPIIGGGVAAGLLAVVVIVIVVLLTGRGGNVSAGGDGEPDGFFRNPVPTADREGLEWEMEELMEHLHSRGLVSEYELGSSYTQAKSKDGGRVVIRKHSGAISAEDHAKMYDYNELGFQHEASGPSFQWGAFTCTTKGLSGDNATSVFGSLRGVRRFDLEDRRKR